MSGKKVKGTVKYLKVAAAVTMMASIGIAYTFGTVEAASVTSDSKIVVSSKETRVEASAAKKKTAKQKEDAKKKAEAKKKEEAKKKAKAKKKAEEKKKEEDKKEEEAKNNSAVDGIVVDFTGSGSGKTEPVKEPVKKPVKDTVKEEANKYVKKVIGNYKSSKYELHNTPGGFIVAYDEDPEMTYGTDSKSSSVMIYNFFSKRTLDVSAKSIETLLGGKLTEKQIRTALEKVMSKPYEKRGVTFNFNDNCIQVDWDK